MKQVKIHIGDTHVSLEPAVIATLLGSCVSVCLYDQIKRVGGMNHILLPGRADLTHFDGAARYGINAMEHVINDLMKIGSMKRNLVAKIFGGAHIIQSVDHVNSPGIKNIEFVEYFLETEKIPLVSRDTGGNKPRRVYFHTSTGDVFVKTLPSLLFGTKVSKQEKAFSNRVRLEMKQESRISLFE